MRNGEPRRRRSRRPSRYGSGLVLFSALVTIGLLVVVVEHREGELPKSADCPTAARVNRALGTRVDSPSAASESDLLGCFYAQGSDSQAVSVSMAVPGPHDADPCRHRPRIVLAGASGCEVSGTRGTSRPGRSLLVDAVVQYQFSTDLRWVTLAQLEDLASEVLSSPPPSFGTNGRG